MTKKTALISGILTLSLAGCTQLKPQPTPTPSPVVQSTGNIDQDLEAIDQELKQDTDIPDFTNTDLGL